ncbi:MAG: Dam family site-specific DNA-(adenine-N6)-methyltransferase [Clostridiales bacterium]|nr:Dam family site-specific DNA-(adenine-N6)-methyltransferase [Clostridiales bacterium]
MYNKEPKPFLKWAGGKTQMLPIFREYYPAALEDGTINRYMEPCVGGGAVLFDLLARYDLVEVTINDINKELITCYRVVQRSVSRLVSILEEWQRIYNLMSQEEQERMYYEKRDRMNQRKKKEIWGKEDELMIAAHMLFLNRTCFNGLYRENRKGQFNVPFNRTKNINFDFENMYLAGEVLKNVRILCQDFQTLTPYVTSRTFIYVDPPYRPVNKTPAFTDFTKDSFDDSKQIRLAEWAREADGLGAAILLDNSDPQAFDENDTFFVDLYQGFEIFHVSGKSSISSKLSSRGKKGDLLIKNAYLPRQAEIIESKQEKEISSSRKKAHRRPQ